MFDGNCQSQHVQCFKQQYFSFIWSWQWQLQMNVKRQGVMEHLQIKNHYFDAKQCQQMLNQCWASIADGGPRLNQHWTHVISLLWYITKYKNYIKSGTQRTWSWQSVCYLKSSTCILMLASCLRLPSPPPSNAMLAIFFCSSLLQIRTSNMLTLQQYIVPLGYDRVYLPYTLSYQRWYIYIFKVWNQIK